MESGTDQCSRLRTLMFPSALSGFTSTSRLIKTTGGELYKTGQAPLPQRLRTEAESFGGQGQQGTVAIVTQDERKSRIYLTKKVFSRKAGEISNAIISMLSDYKYVCHTITFNNGGEFREHQSIAEALEAEMYFAHPYAPHERGK